MIKTDKEKIDAVILWVDDTDEKWIEEKNKYSNLKGDKSIIRFRDCKNLNYVFRSIEKNMPWINNIFFVTCGQTPKWLNVNHPKLKMVNHKDFIPEKYLPTFNSNVIEMNLHRIDELSEKFILFNDDIFVTDYAEKEYFFKDNIPTDMYCEAILAPRECYDNFFFTMGNCVGIINSHFNKKDFFENHIDKIYNPLYEEYNEITKKLTSCKDRFTGFICFHTAQPYLKSTFKEVWEKEEKALDIACQNKFRAPTDISHFVCRYWQMITGNFVPRKDQSKYFAYLDDNTEAIDAITNNKYKVVCINDVYTNINFEKSRDEINDALEKILPDKCSYEK